MLTINKLPFVEVNVKNVSGILEKLKYVVAWMRYMDCFNLGMGEGGCCWKMPTLCYLRSDIPYTITSNPSMSNTQGIIEIGSIQRGFVISAPSSREVKTVRNSGNTLYPVFDMSEFDCIFIEWLNGIEHSSSEPDVCMTRLQMELCRAANRKLQPAKFQSQHFPYVIKIVRSELK